MQELRFLGSGPAAMLGVTGLRQRERGIEARMVLAAGAVGPDGGTAVGSLGVLVDEVLGYTIMGSLPQGAWSISTEIWIDVVGALPRRGEELVAEGTSVTTGSYSRGQVRDSSGCLVVECRQRGRAVPPPPEMLERAAVQRAPAASCINRLDTLLGLRAEGDAHVLQARLDLANPLSMLHGGVSLAASDTVAARSRLENDSSLQTSSIHIVHTRGVPLDADVVFHAETRHAGRTLWVTDVVGTVDGRVCTVATVTAQA